MDPSSRTRCSSRDRARPSGHRARRSPMTTADRPRAEQARRARRRGAGGAPGAGGPSGRSGEPPHAPRPPPRRRRAPRPMARRGAQPGQAPRPPIPAAIARQARASIDCRAAKPRGSARLPVPPVPGTARRGPPAGRSSADAGASGHGAGDGGRATGSRRPTAPGRRGGGRMTVAAVILAATPASALADAAGRPAVRRIAETAWAGGAMPLIVVSAGPRRRRRTALAGSEAVLVAPAPSESRSGRPDRARHLAAVDLVAGTERRSCGRRA